MELSGKVALVTGAGRRVGRAIAVALAKAGAEVLVHYHHSRQEAEGTVEAIRAAGRPGRALCADLACPEEIAGLFAEIAGAPGRLDVLVNNAAVYHRTPLETLTAGQWDAEMAINARAPALCIRHALPLMREGGAIINIVDISADAPRPAYPAYCASKAALWALTVSAAKALAERKIRVNAVSPGVAAWPEDASPQQIQTVLARVPQGRAGAPEDIAEAVLFLARQDYITGENLRVDGGWHLTLGG